MIPGPAFQPVLWRATPLQRLHPATRLAGAVLAVVSLFAVGPGPAFGLLAVASGLLAWTGLTFAAQLRALRPWWGLAVFLVAVQTFLGNPLVSAGTPTVAGAAKGLSAVLRVAGAAAWLGLFARAASLDDLVTGLNFWLRPLRRLGKGVQDVPLVLAVALGTAPVMLGEGRRIQAVTALRSTGTRDGTSAARPGLLRRTLERGRVLVPLLENLARRADALSLSLAKRRPSPATGGPVPWPEGLVLGLWTAGLVGLALARAGVTS